jgi:predicted dehydrogenase
VHGILERDAVFGTDKLASGTLDFGQGWSTFTCSTQLAPYQRIHIFGEDGRVEIEVPGNAPPDRPCKMWHQRGEAIEKIVFDICDQYTLQCDAMARCILDDTPVPTPLSDAVANMRVVEAVVESAETATWVRIKP